MLKSSWIYHYVLLKRGLVLCGVSVAPELAQARLWTLPWETLWPWNAGSYHACSVDLRTAERDLIQPLAACLGIKNKPISQVRTTKDQDQGWSGPNSLKMQIGNQRSKP